MEKYWNKDAIADRLKVVHENISSAVLKTGKATSDLSLIHIQMCIRDRDYVGTTMRVLPEGIGKTGEGTLTSRDSGNLIVELDGNEDLIGKFVTVKIVSAMNWALKGELISE